MIRTITPNDSAAVIAVAVASGVFPEEETPFLDKMLTDYFGGNINEGHVCLIDDEGEPRGVAYYVPEPVTEGTWNLLLIAIKTDNQRQGRGTALLHHVEEALRSNGQRLLLVETSGLPSFERARAFYAKCGYEEEARIRDYYKAGEDMVVFRKVLNAG